jgi:hypothetical protein
MEDFAMWKLEADNYFADIQVSYVLSTVLFISYTIVYIID